MFYASKGLSPYALSKAMSDKATEGELWMIENSYRNLSGKQKDILELAQKLFLKQGYYKTSIRQIVRELDISLGLVAYYYPTKRELAETIFSIQHYGETQIVRQYVSQVDDPILFSGTLTKLQMTIFNSPTFQRIYLDALREDIICDVIIKSGLDTYRLISQKYDLGYSDDYLALYGNFNAIALERILLLYGRENQLVTNVPDTVFKSYMKYLYGDEQFLEECCKKTDEIVEQILLDRPELLNFWIS